MLISPTFAFAQEVPATGGQNTGGATASSSAVPPTGGQNTGGADAGVPSTAGQNTGSADAGVPSTGGKNTGGASVIIDSIPTTGGQNTGGATAGSVSTASVVNTITPITSTPGGSVSSGGGSSSIYSSTPGTINCLYLTQSMKIGATNSVEQVTKLQTFLKNNEKMNLDVTGIFDEKTSVAVSAFQAKYASEILAPWGITNPTGHVYHTTLKKMNELACNTQVSLTPAQKDEIANHKISLEKTPKQIVDTKDTSNKDTVSASTTDSTSTTKTSFMKKMWNFVKRIFGR